MTDSQKVAPLEQCQVCGGSIYPGEMVYVMACGYILCAKADCLAAYVQAEETTIEDALEMGE